MNRENLNNREGQPNSTSFDKHYLDYKIKINQNFNYIYIHN